MEKIIKGLRKMLGVTFLGACLGTVIGVVFFALTIGNQLAVYIAQDNYNYASDYSQYKWQANDEYEELTSLNKKLTEEGNFASKWFFNLESNQKYLVDFLALAQPFIAYLILKINFKLRDCQMKLAKKRKKLNNRAKNIIHSKNLVVR